MRISTQQMFGRGLDSMQDVNSQLQKTQMQISTGKRLLTPSDDPVASARIVQLNQELSLNKQYQSNIDMAENRLTMQDDLLGSINDVLHRVRELTTQAGNGALSVEDKNTIAAELRQRLDQVAGMMNSKDASGEFMFAGYQGKQAPFVKDVSGHYRYQGDEGQRYIQVDKSVTVATSENGKRLFMDVPSAQKTFTTSASPSNTAQPPATISTGQVIDQEAFEAIYPDRMVVEFEAGGTSYTIKLASNNKVLASSQPYVQGAPISVAGVQFEIEGQPRENDSFLIETTPKQGFLTTVEKLIYGLEHVVPGEEGQKVLSSLIDDTLVNLKNAETAILDTRGRIGARLNVIESTREMHADVAVLSKEVLSELQDLDYAEAVSRMTMEGFVLQAAQQTYTRVTGLSLFDQI